MSDEKDEKDELGLSPTAWDRLNREQAYLMQARSHHKLADDTYLVQMALAELQDRADAVGVIRQFTALVEAGITPPPHILAAVAKGFRRHIGSNGAATLQESFFNTRNGNPVAKMVKKAARASIYWHMWNLINSAEASGRTMSIYAAAADAINQFGLTITIDALEKDYIQSKVGKMLDEVSDATK